jgi:hypothetical protein
MSASLPLSLDGDHIADTRSVRAKYEIALHSVIEVPVLSL